MIDFQTAQTDSMLNTRDAHDSQVGPQSAIAPQATTPVAETVGFDLDLADDSSGNPSNNTSNTSKTSKTSSNHPGHLHELPLQIPTLTNSPGCAPARPSKPKTPTPCRHVRTVRVDAWAVPVSANWSRTRTMARKVGRGTRSTDWALPF